MELIFDKLNRFFSGKWQIAILDLQAGRWVLRPKTSYISYLKAENANGRHILIRPPPEKELYYLLADDLTRRLIRGHHKYPDGTWKHGRMVVETSPADYQVWIRSSRPLSLEEKRHWLKELRSDPGADQGTGGDDVPVFGTGKRSIAIAGEVILSPGLSGLIGNGMLIFRLPII